MFPTPQLENVYSAWKPLDHGHPLVDVTIHYAPPELERVHIGAGPVPNRPPTSAGNKWVETRAGNEPSRSFYSAPRRPTRAFSWLKAATTAFTFKTHTMLNKH